MQKVEMNSAVDDVIELGIAAIVSGGFLSVAISEIINASTTGWGTALTSMWGILSLFVVICDILIFVHILSKHKV